MLYIQNDKETRETTRWILSHQGHTGTAYKTGGGLRKSDILMNRWGRIVSAKKHKTAKQERRLEKHGFFAQKGRFGYTLKKK
jgi:hypothetical protein